MLNARPVGRTAAARKYDVITALGAHALGRDKHAQRLTLRLITLITARYNWQRDLLCIGQREIARLWSVDERTVKREMAKLRACGWLVVKRQGARGRVTEYGLDIERLLDDTRGCWEAVGPDFDLRMQGGPGDGTVVPMPVRGDVAAPDISSGTEWALARAIIHGEDAGLYSSWIAALARDDRQGGRLRLRAPSRFHGAYVQANLGARLLAAVRAVDGDVSDIEIVS